MNRLDKHLHHKSWLEKLAALETIHDEIKPKLERLRLWDGIGETSLRSELSGRDAALPNDAMKHLSA